LDKAWIVTVAFLGPVLVSPSTSVAAAQKTTKDGVFSEAQAKRGEVLFKGQCASCHATDLSGGGAPALAGADFLDFLDRTPVFKLVARIKDSMPANAPGSLNTEQATDITAYILYVNKFPAGTADLPSDSAAQQVITIVQ
jgi:mono/diheme cytochrome c family protein